LSENAREKSEKSKKSQALSAAKDLFASGRKETLRFAQGDRLTPPAALKDCLAAPLAGRAALSSGIEQRNSGRFHRG
jgi:hypothetical protein